jgi:hypothetical protein
MDKTGRAPDGPAEKKWKKVIHVAKRECCLDDEAYRALLAGAAGVDSARDIKTWKQYQAVMGAFKNLGFVYNGHPVKRVKNPQSARNPRWITEKQEYYIRGLWDLASRNKDEDSLRRLIRRLTGADDIGWIKRTDASKVIQALRDIAEKAGYDPDAPGKD